MLTQERRGDVAWLTLDRPEKLNAMPRDFWPELRTTMEKLDGDGDVAVIVFRGAGRCFSVGGDIADFGNVGGVSDRRAYMREAIAAFRAVDDCRKPVIAAVHGHAVGGGCELTMVCDIVVADETARFGTPEAGVGLVPGIAMIRGLSHVNTHWLKYMVFTGIPLKAQQAQLAGLVNVVVPEGEHEAEAERLARIIATRSGEALEVGKAFLNRGAWANSQYAAEAIALLQSGDDFAEGVNAFRDGRSPEFRAARSAPTDAP